MSFKYKELVLGEEYADLLSDLPATQVHAEDIEARGEELIQNLNAQLTLYRDYLEQANRQRMALVNRKLDENSHANVESERLIGSLNILEEKRIQITLKILGMVNPGTASKPNDFAQKAKCENIYPLLSPVNAARLKTCRDALVKATAEVKYVLGINMALVENGSRIIHTTVGIMTSVVGRKQNEKMNTYTARGSVRIGKIQVRNLINRSV
jgi:FlgN protein